MAENANAGRSAVRQVLGSITVALLIVTIVIVALTLRLGPTSIAELESREEAAERRIERQEERIEAREERREVREESGD